MARWHHGQPHRGNQPPRADGRSLSTQNDRRRAGSVPRDPPRTRFGTRPTRRWSRFLCYLVRRVAHAPGGFDPPRSRGATPQNERRSGHFGRAVAAAVTRISKSGCRPETRARFSISGGVVHPAISKSGPRDPRATHPPRHGVRIFCPWWPPGCCGNFVAKKHVGTR